ncbi:UNKNOWN [Stylonychia lemnae]|uniref:Cyclic nucleotide-binding domain-containing protein n=1 Tax=Stylonychia lemnae TaxID=5949 RepID=A0A077ZT93_STYLE|nr:UNKNOWN [Stylonychia lemnae]|eukprot:CDW72769.1 UNKNOWN [Stylonychia lemnae]
MSLDKQLKQNELRFSEMENMQSSSLQEQTPVQSPKIKQIPLLERLIRILQKGQRTRNEKDLEHLVPLIKEIQFFKERDIKDQDFVEIVSCLTYENFKMGDTVFEWGTNGDKFYIIIEGHVSVMIPHPDIKDVNAQIDQQRSLIDQKKDFLKGIQVQIDAEKRDIDKKLQESLIMNKKESIKLQASYESPENRRKTMIRPAMKINSSLMNQEYYSSNNLTPEQQKQWSVSKPSFNPINSNNKSFSFNRPSELLSVYQNIPQQSTSSMIGLMTNQSSIINKPSARNYLNLNMLEKITDQKSNTSSESSKYPSNSRREDKKHSSRQNIKKDLSLEEQKQQILEQIKELRYQEEQSLFIEIVKLQSGKSFGEIALIKNKPRAATIKCNTDCHLAVMSKSDYQKVLQRIEQKSLNKIVDFLHQIPFLHSWTRTSLSKLQYSFEQRIYKRNQTIYKEGEESNYVYLVKSGEFEVSKRIQFEEKKKLNTKDYLGVKEEEKDDPKKVISYVKVNQDSLDMEDFLAQTSKEKKKKQKGSIYIEDNSKLQNPQISYKLAIVGCGQLLGEEDVLSNNRRYTTNVTCSSIQGEIFCIKSDEFHRRVKSNNESWKVVILMALAKERAIRAKIFKVRKIIQTKREEGYSALNQVTSYLLNQNEYDLRETIREIIDQFPSVEDHKKLIQYYSVRPDFNSRQQKTHLIENETSRIEHSKSKESRVKFSKKTIDMSFNEMAKTSNIMIQNLKDQNHFSTKRGENSQERNNYRMQNLYHQSLSPVNKDEHKQQIKNSSSKCYISSKIANILDVFEKEDDIGRENSPSFKIKRKLQPDKLEFKLDKQSRLLKNMIKNQGEQTPSKTQRPLSNSKTTNEKLKMIIEDQQITQNLLGGESRQAQMQVEGHQAQGQMINYSQFLDSKITHSKNLLSFDKSNFPQSESFRIPLKSLNILPVASQVNPLKNEVVSSSNQINSIGNIGDAATVNNKSVIGDNSTRYANFQSQIRSKTQTKNRSGVILTQKMGIDSIKLMPLNHSILGKLEEVTIPLAQPLKQNIYMSVASTINPANKYRAQIKRNLANQKHKRLSMRERQFQRLSSNTNGTYFNLSQHQIQDI